MRAWLLPLSLSLSLLSIYISLCHMLLHVPPLWIWCLTFTSLSFKNPSLVLSLTVPPVSSCSLLMPLSTLFRPTFFLFFPTSSLETDVTGWNYRQIKRGTFPYHGWRQAVRGEKQKWEERNVKEMAAGCSSPSELKHPIITEFLKLFPGFLWYSLSIAEFRRFSSGGWSKTQTSWGTCCSNRIRHHLLGGSMWADEWVSDGEEWLKQPTPIS